MRRSSGRGERAGGVSDDVGLLIGRAERLSFAEERDFAIVIALVVAPT